ncbi:TIGR02680 family protein [Carnobacterium sp. ISL-102]|uniref:TIGR02680 family protein n=1 Tax=Carnobacterium sp. ISL-102 TaxID=2819142 RepID=UPI001BECB8D7|nr:TIGR02680 family protein [Carnobacterium sp. ISL-102]MBT2732256.1 TIGR02680 family protein [Carnobacterium sp. ISL-102]
MTVDQVNKWMLNRAGVLNFWYYDEEEFSFNNGHLLLRGSNGSGKTVTMTSLFPFLLDGRKSPERMDSFGSRDRRMIDYLLGEKGFYEEMDEKTGYLYLEFKREDTPQYLTIGMGLNARKSRGSDLDSWGFSITDNRRIGHDLKLFKEEKGINQTTNKIPLTRKQLVSAIGEGGQVVKGQKDYAQMVNRLLFGYEEIEAFEELMELLVQIRAPKLSNNFKPSTIYDILNKSLPALTEDELRPLAETMETMDDHRDQIDLLKNEITQFNFLSKEYQKYNDTLLKTKLNHYLEAKKQNKGLEAALESLQQEISNLLKDLSTNQQLEQRKERESQSLQIELETLKSSEIFTYQEKKFTLEKKINSANKELYKQEEALDKKRERINQYRNQVDNMETAIYRNEKETIGQLSELEGLQETVQYPNHDFYFQQMQLKTNELSWSETLTTWSGKISEYRIQINFVIKLWQTYQETTQTYTNYFKEFDITREALQKLREDLTQYQEILISEKNQFRDRVYQWLASSDWLTFDQSEQQLFERKVDYIYEKTEEEELVKPFLKKASDFIEQLQYEKINLEHLLSQLDQNWSNLQEEKLKWEQLFDPEPERLASSEKERQVLKEAGKMILPLYQAIDFKETVSEDIRQSLEAALEDSGLLDALILEDDLAEGVKHNRILQANPQKNSQTLEQFVVPVSENLFIANRVQDIIESIVVCDKLNSNERKIPQFTTDGTYSLGIILGNVPQEKYGAQHFIGKKQREDYRKSKINELEDRSSVIVQQQLEIKEQVKKLEDKQWENQQWKIDQPSPVDMRVAFNGVSETEQRTKNQENEAKRKDDLLKECINLKQNQEAVLKEKTKEFNFEFNFKSYQEAQEDSPMYQLGLKELEKLYESSQDKKAAMVQSQISLEESEADLDDLRQKEQAIREDIQHFQFDYQRVLNHLKEMGETNLQQQIEQVKRDFEKAQKQSTQARDVRVRLEERIPTLEEKERIEKENVTFNQELVLNWEKLLQAELQFQGKDEVQLEATDVLKTLFDQLQQKTYATPKDAHNRLSSVYTRVYDQLMDYRIVQPLETLMTIDIDYYAESRKKTEWQIVVNQMYDETQRTVLIAEYRGSRKGIQQVYEQLQEDLEYQKLMLRKDEDRLYRDIIINNLGKMIQGKVLRAEQWVQETENYMRKRHNSSGLLFSIRWKPITGETEQQMNTRELVTILRKGPDLLRETEIEKVRQHFQSKIDYARAEAKDDGKEKSFFQALTQILDYRNWFNFELHYKKGEQDFRPLTNRAFNQMSGGEKAMTMYIPLFSAAHSRYQHAKKDAPYIVVLDEAFAGVDELNIQDMFGLIEDLNFNYVLTSQSLWGDYPNVKSLSICELIRPNSADFVTVIQYSWNGKERLLALPNLEELDERKQEATDTTSKLASDLKQEEKRQAEISEVKERMDLSEPVIEQSKLF